jgi:hypothetical protein
MPRVLIPGTTRGSVRGKILTRAHSLLASPATWAGVLGLVLASILALPRPAEAREIPREETAVVRSRLEAAKTPDAHALAKALGVEVPSTELPPDSAQNLLEDLGDLDGDGVPEYALEWTGEKASAAGAAQSQQAAASWELFLLAWDGSEWQVSPLMTDFESFLLQVLPRTHPDEREIALVIFAGAAGVPYPAVFRFKAHRASLAWDGRSDESRYEGYDRGQVVFGSSQGTLQMVATGRADPGFLVFPKNGNRGFDGRTIYNWDGQAFIPAKTEYSRNRDFTLYRFIAALHLRDFRTAYSLIDAARFLKTDNPSLEAFRKMVEDSWPEFLDDKIFRARDSAPENDDFELRLDDKVYVYVPTFDATRLLLTGLEREEREPDSE